METMKTGWEWLTNIIPSLKDGAISMDKLAYDLHMEPRDLRRLIAAARRDGAIICSSSRGYYKPTTLPDLREHARYMMSRIETSWISLRPALHLLRKWDDEAMTNTIDIQQRLSTLYALISHEIEASWSPHHDDNEEE